MGLDNKDNKEGDHSVAPSKRGGIWNILRIQRLRWSAAFFRQDQITLGS